MDRILCSTLVHWHSIHHSHLPPTTPPQSTLFHAPRESDHPTSIALGFCSKISSQECLCIDVRKVNRERSEEDGLFDEAAIGEWENAW